MGNREADFLEPTKEAIARRSGFRCAFLDCDMSTIGPGAKAEDCESHGVVAHIFSSAPKGPRGTGGLSIKERKSPLNGILLCAIHSRVIDLDKGKNYPASLLQSWKALHESRIAKEMKGLPLIISAGWIKGINFIKSPLFKSGQKLVFGKVTLLFGLNGTGKTATCEWLASTSGHVRLMERWVYKRRSENIKMEIEYLNPELTTAEVLFKDSAYSCKVGGSTVESLQHAFRVIYLKNELTGRETPKGDVEYLAYNWGVHPFQVPDILSKMGPEKYGFVRKAEIRDEPIDEDDQENQETELRVYAQIGDHREPLPFRNLSGREQGQVLLIGGMIVAEGLSTVTPTLLIIESSGTYFPDGLLSEYAERLASHEFQFQTIIVSPDERKKVNWTGWSIARFQGMAPEIEIHQDDIFGG